ncbi:MAG TPA: Hsp20/alpha crystallin family protein [Candidatus Limnocylindrales bacterium]|jgi:HSP20 family protein|nr:Hsp20/alpha crystallin family protein [Candidatus Limnocylindrales bacterium]
MAILRWDPFRDLSIIQERMNKLFEESIARSRGEEGTSLAAWVPPVDIYETKDAIVVKAELPGIDQKDIEVQVHDNILTIRGERKFESDVKRENFHRIERAYGTFQRSFSIPNTIRQDQVKARFHNGILEITLPKMEEAKPRQIKVDVVTS